MMASYRIENIADASVAICHIYANDMGQLHKFFLFSVKQT